MSSKKICILCAANLKHMTLISLYTKELVRAKQDFDIIYLDKYNEKETYKSARRLYKYKLNLNNQWSFFRKFLHYWSFKNYAIEIIKREKYDFIILWNEFTVFMFSDYVSKKYSGRYCVNIRDQNYNKVPFVQHRYKQAIKNSCFNTVSSERFKSIFPKNEYLFVHSFNREIMEGINPVKDKRNINLPIRIMFIGRMSYPESIYTTLDALGNDKRFELWLIGERCETLLPYIKKRGYRNVIVHGSFEPKETASFLRNADIIYSLNKEKDVHCDTLLPIKLYYSIGKHIPILAYKSSFTYEYSQKYEFAIGITSDDFSSLGDIIYNKYNRLSQKKIDRGCEKALSEINFSHNVLNEKINKFILS